MAERDVAPVTKRRLEPHLVGLLEQGMPVPVVGIPLADRHPTPSSGGADAAPSRKKLLEHAVLGLHDVIDRRPVEEPQRRDDHVLDVAGREHPLHDSPA